MQREMPGIFGRTMRENVRKRPNDDDGLEGEKKSLARKFNKEVFYPMSIFVFFEIKTFLCMVL